MSIIDRFLQHIFNKKYSYVEDCETKIFDNYGEEYRIAYQCIEQIRGKDFIVIRIVRKV